MFKTYPSPVKAQNDGPNAQNVDEDVDRPESLGEPNLKEGHLTFRGSS